MAVSVRKKKSVVLSCKPGGSMCFKERDFSTMATEGVSWPVPMRAIGAQNLLTMPGGVSTSGYLHKKGGSQISLLRWPLRYLIIHKGCVYYFKSSTSAQPQGAFSLNGYHRVMRASEETTSSNVFPFKIIHLSKKQRTWYFSAASEDERRKWMKALRKEMNYYNDRKDSMNPSDSDSDTDSFYGTIERSVDIKSTPLDPEADYMMEDDDEDDDDEADYVKPDDSPPPCIGKPPVPPPAYPPPPVPFQTKKDSAAGYFKTLPLPLPPPHHRNSSGPAHRNLPPAFPPPKPAASLKDPPAKGPAPPLPFAPHLAKPGTDLRRTLRTSPPPAGPLPTSPSIPPSVPPPPPCASLKKEVAGGRTAAGFATFPVTGGGGRGRSPASAPAPPATLPFCADPKRRMVSDGPGGGGAAPSPGYRGNGPPAGPPPLPRLASPLLGAPTPPPKHASLRPPPIPKPASPSTGHRGPSLQRLSPVGQSFRTSGDADAGHFLSCRKPKQIRDPSRSTEDDSDDDDDYENVQLPASVFVDTTETLNIERLFKKISTSPKDGLYCIRNSGTGKTSQVLVVWDVSLGKARNYRLFQQDSCVFLEADLSFPTLAALVEHYHVHPLPNNGSLCLQQPYGRITPR